MVRRRLLSSKIDVPSKYFGLKCKVPLRVDGSCMRTLVEAYKLGKQSQCRRNDIVLFGCCRCTTDKTASDGWLQECLGKKCAVLEEITVAGKDLEQEREHSCYLRDNRTVVGFHSMIPPLGEVLQKRLVLFIPSSSFLCVQVLAKYGSLAGQVVLIGWVED
jgi:hypothetical protein